MISKDKDIRLALEARKKYEEKYQNYMILGKREFLDDVRSLEITDLVNFGDTEEEEPEYGDPSGVEPFMMLDLEELTDLSPRNFKLKSKNWEIVENQKKWEFEKKKGFELNTEGIGIDDLLNTNIKISYEEREIDDEEGKLIELDSRFTGSGFKGVLGDGGLPKQGRMLDFDDLVNIDESKSSSKSQDPIINLSDLIGFDEGLA